ncbi:hypothetical protein NCAS_0B03950 [Naumovozyma castellii]|uniref:Uncharacterized protein n=1 Tax=Naumovozyma castellii TaxID=27288 RepID=G0V9Z4_NAUCA|nr:hypothetical protein NCAS_0B03950 [Naumovozyma castellii CBS 4309]CCC68479.1 hypothetical protein NCAS_0B03950 [Naumovozyma castellii CBS 4309]
MSALPATAFKFGNILLGSTSTLAALSQLSYISSNFVAVPLALYALVLSIGTVYLEFKIPSNIFNFASFYFSFLGRGLTYILISILLSFGGALKKINMLLLFFYGLAHVAFQFTPFVEEPNNYRSAGSSISIGDDDNDDNDEVI